MHSFSENILEIAQLRDENKLFLLASPISALHASPPRSQVLWVISPGLLWDTAYRGVIVLLLRLQLPPASPLFFIWFCISPGSRKSQGGFKDFFSSLVGFFLCFFFVISVFWCVWWFFFIKKKEYTSWAKDGLLTSTHVDNS